jgi:hypothetical protein
MGSIRPLQAIVAFGLGAFFGPMVMAKVMPKKQS